VFKDLLRGPSNLDVTATQDCPWVAARRSSRVFVLAALGILLSLTGCGSTTIFQSSFDSNAVGSPPSPKQATGTVALGGAKDHVVIAIYTEILGGMEAVAGSVTLFPLIGDELISGYHEMRSLAAGTCQ
jgi:hypothetical protein